MKTPKLKKREVSINSRAARRGEVADKETSSRVKGEETEHTPWLHRTQDAGVARKKKHKQPSRNQKLRQQRALEKADVNVDKLKKKMADSKARGKKVQARRKEWDELNGMALSKEKDLTENLPAERATTAEAGQDYNPVQTVQVPNLDGCIPLRLADAEIDIERTDEPADVSGTVTQTDDLDDIT